MRQLSLKSWQVGRQKKKILLLPLAHSLNTKRSTSSSLSETPGRMGTLRPSVTPKFNFCLVPHAVWCTFLIWFRAHSATGNFCHQEGVDYLSTLEIAELMMAITYKLLIRWCFHLTRINLLATVSRPQCLPALQPMEAALSLFLVHSA